MSGEWVSEPDYMVAGEGLVGMSKDGRYLAVKITGELFADDEGTGMTASWVVAFAPEAAENLVEMILNQLGAPQVTDYPEEGEE